MCVDNSFKWSDLVQTLIAIASLVISLMAYLLAKKISLKKTVKDRQFDLVSKFISAFTSSLISVSYQSDRGGGGSIFYLSQMRSEKFLKEQANLFIDTRIIIQEDGFNHFNFMPLIGDPFLPDELFVELKKFWFHAQDKINVPQAADKYLIICNHKDYSNPTYHTVKGNEFADFKSFYNFINRIMDITDDWLEKHDAPELKFKRT